MSLCCVICGQWYQTEGRDTLDICPPCFSMNFASAQPPLDPWGPCVRARAALEAYVETPHPLSGRQRDAMARRHVRWEEEAVRRLAGEDLP